MVIETNKMKKTDGRTVTVENTVRYLNLGEHLPTNTTSRKCVRLKDGQEAKKIK